MKYTDKHHEGVVVKATAHENPKNIPDRYVFSGTDSETELPAYYAMTVLAVPGFLTPAEFAADIAIRSPMPGELVTDGPRHFTGRFSYVRPDTGGPVDMKADDIEPLTKDLVPAPRAPLSPRDREQARRVLDAERQRQEALHTPAAKPVRKLPDNPDEMPEFPPSLTPPRELPTPKPIDRGGMDRSF